MYERERKFKQSIFVVFTIIAFSMVSSVYNNGAYLFNIAYFIDSILENWFKGLMIINSLIIGGVLYYDAYRISYYTEEKESKIICNKLRILIVVNILYFIFVGMDNYFINDSDIKENVIKINVILKDTVEGLQLDKFISNEFLSGFESSYTYVLYFCFVCLVGIVFIDWIFRKRFVLILREYSKYFIVYLFFSVNVIFMFTHSRYSLNTMYKISLILTSIEVIVIIKVIYGYISKKESIAKILLFVSKKIQDIKNKFKIGENLEESKVDVIYQGLFKDREAQAESLKKAIDSVFKDNELRGYSVAIAGEWGSGKTYFIQSFVNKHYDNSFVWVTPSIFIKKEDLYQEIIKGIEKVFRQNKLYSNKNDSVGQYLTKLIDLYRTKKLSVNSLFYGKGSYTFEDVRENLEKYVNIYLKAVGKPIIIVIDDFDRLEYHFDKKNEEKEILQVIYELTNIKGLIVLYSIKSEEKYFDLVYRSNLESDEFEENKRLYRRSFGIKVDDDYIPNIYYRKYINEYLTLKKIDIEKVTDTLLRETNIFKFECKNLDNEQMLAIKNILDFYFNENQPFDEQRPFNVRQIEQIIIKYQGLIKRTLNKIQKLDKTHYMILAVFSMIKELYPLEYQKIMNCNNYFLYENDMYNFIRKQTYEDWKSQHLFSCKNMNQLLYYIFENKEINLYEICIYDNEVNSIVVNRFNGIKEINKIFYKEYINEQNDIMEWSIFVRIVDNVNIVKYGDYYKRGYEKKDRKLINHYFNKLGYKSKFENYDIDEVLSYFYSIKNINGNIFWDIFNKIYMDFNQLEYNKHSFCLELLRNNLSSIENKDAIKDDIVQHVFEWRESYNEKIGYIQGFGRSRSNNYEFYKSKKISEILDGNYEYIQIDEKMIYNENKETIIFFAEQKDDKIVILNSLGDDCDLDYHIEQLDEIKNQFIEYCNKEDSDITLFQRIGVYIIQIDLIIIMLIASKKIKKLGL